MGRCGVQSCVGFLVLLSLSMLVFFNQHTAAFAWTSSASSSSLSMAVGSKGLHQRNMVVGVEETRRRRLQQVPAPAPGPAASGTETYIGYGVLTAGYVPCPPQTGRSYYTSNCQSATGPVNPYSRGCSSITLCARG